MIETAAVSGVRPRLAKRLVAFALGGLAGATVVIGVVGLGGAALLHGQVPLAALVLLGGLGAASELSLVRLPMPRRRQVPAVWRSQFGVTVALGLYGAVLGAGLFTTITHFSFLLVIALALVLGPGALFVGVAYAASKTAAITLGVLLKDEWSTAQLLRLSTAVRMLNAVYLLGVSFSLVRWSVGIRG